MFLKIFKHAFTRPLKTVLAMLVIGIIAGITAGVCQKLYDVVREKYMDLFFQDVSLAQDSIYRHLTSIFSTLSTVLVIAMILLIASQIFVVYSAFHKAIATDEAYLTYTLPASNGQQTGARYLALLVWHVIIVLGAVISFTCLNVISTGISANDNNSVKLSDKEILIFIEMIILTIVAFSSFVAHGQFGIVFSNVLSQKLKRKMSAFLVSWLFFVEMVVLLITLIIVLAIDKSSHFTLWFFIVLTGSLGWLTYNLSYKFMGRRLNVA